MSLFPDFLFTDIAVRMLPRPDLEDFSGGGGFASAVDYIISFATLLTPIVKWLANTMYWVNYNCLLDATCALSS